MNPENGLQILASISEPMSNVLAYSIENNPITGSRWAGKSRFRIGTDPKGRGKYNKMLKRRKKKGYQ